MLIFKNAGAVYVNVKTACSQSFVLTGDKISKSKLAFGLEKSVKTGFCCFKMAQIILNLTMSQ